MHVDVYTCIYIPHPHTPTCSLSVPPEETEGIPETTGPRNQYTGVAKPRLSGIETTPGAGVQ